MSSRDGSSAAPPRPPGLTAALAAALAALALLAPPDGAGASVPDSTRADRLRWRGRPRPDCASFLVTEVGAHYLLRRVEPWQGERRFFLTGDLGYMRNRGERSALGGLLHLGTEYQSPSDRTGFGGAVRYRRWLSRWGAVDVTVGLDVLGSLNPGGRLGSPAPWIEAEGSVEDLLALSVRAERWTATAGPLLPDGTVGPRSVTTWHVGAKGCSYVGAAAAVAIGVTAAVLLGPLAGGN